MYHVCVPSIHLIYKAGLDFVLLSPNNEAFRESYYCIIICIILYLIVFNINFSNVCLWPQVNKKRIRLPGVSFCRSTLHRKNNFEVCITEKKLNIHLLAFRRNMVMTRMFIHKHKIVVVQHLNCR